MTSLRDQHLERKQARHEKSQYYRIKTQYVHTAVIQLSSFQNKQLRTKSYSERLNVFHGKIISRVKESTKQHTSLYEDYKYSAKLAIQNTVIDYFIKYCDEQETDFWSLDWIEVKFKFYISNGKYFCRVDYIEDLTVEDAEVRIDEDEL